MADIFISYSSKDRAQAEQLTELLASAGLSVWIDKSGIDVATSWSGEIVDAIEGCKAFVVLLSPNSVGSVNVVKEVSLAAEQKKKILPLDLEPVELPRDLKYHLAGLQRAPMTNIDSIIRAIGKLGLEATQPPTIKLVKETDSRKSLMILPFEDMSPTGDNGWFADGLAAELISALSHVKSLRVADQQATKDYKRYQGTLPNYAKEMSIRYFIQGSVRKFCDQIKITSSLLDIETGDHLWQDSMKGTMGDIFDIQEKVAEKVVEGLKVHLASDERKKLAERGTENAEAYELYLRSIEYHDLNTKEGVQISTQLLTNAIELDPGFAIAYSYKAIALTTLYRRYDPNPDLLIEAEVLSKEALRLKPDLFKVYQAFALVYMLQGKRADAESSAREFIQNDPENAYAYFSLGAFYFNTGESAKAIPPYEEAVRRDPENRILLYNLVIACGEAKEREKGKKWAIAALPVEERYLKLHPNDEVSRMRYSHLLFYSGRREDALREAMILTQARDAFPLFNTACLLAEMDEKQLALEALRKSIEAGFAVPHVMQFLADEVNGLGQLAGTPEYEAVKRMVEKLSEP